MSCPDRNVRPFERDILVHGGYLYAGDQLSARLANARQTEAVLAATDFENARVIDIGCGDGTYTHELAALARTAQVHGVDLAGEVIEVARAKSDGDHKVSFQVASTYELPYPHDAFNLAVLRSVLHHVDRPVDALREAFRVAPTLVVVEPNGLNPGLKFNERYSQYHVEHGERSYSPRQLDRWVAALDARVVRRQWVGFVPTFSPDWYARMAKRVEPLVERTPGVMALGCAQYVFTASRDQAARPEVASRPPPRGFRRAASALLRRPQRGRAPR
ncbi:MAG: class I SAM-dependent methyltransferase [Thermoleophilaceae bacterium]|jgi:ubiquinone/menaquinone biosynthesis C-methylase UbiE|nr:class I SAM-dependent methyltransferase [Thermoleophilaceae bacterium]